MTFIKFPRTPHLIILPGLDIRDDKQLPKSEAEKFFTNPIIIEEKIDGANVGISVGPLGDLRVQNRGNFIYPGSDRQFDTIWEWAYIRNDLFTKHLADKYILFGEWCYYKHSIFYNSLPDWFLGIDLFDISENKFLNTPDRIRMFSELNITAVPIINSGIFSRNIIIDLLNSQKSRFSSERIEGLYFRLEDNFRLISRAKIVRNDFIQNIKDHWKNELPKKNFILKHGNG
jgi:ATP-dependent RNA circularization protein (DNA/RNA ligase family)